MADNISREDEKIAKETADVRHCKGAVYGVSFIAAMAGLLFGLDIGVISGALPFLAKEFSAGTEMQEWIVSSLLFGAFLGTLGSGFISRRFGRKKALLVSAIVFATGSILSAVTTSSIMLIGVRLFLGLAVGIASFTAPLYLSEMAPSRIRGRLIAMYQLLITIGILTAYLSDTFLSYGGHWREMLGMLAIPATLMFLGILFLPNSPRWLVLVGRREDAVKALQKLRHEDEIEQEMLDIEKALENKQKGIELLFKNKFFLKAIILGIGLQAIQQFTGMNVVMYYAPKIFSIAGFQSTAQQMWGTVLVGLVNVLATFIAIAFVDRLGRKPILFAGFCVMGLSMGTLGTLFHMGITNNTMEFLAVGALLVFIIGFAMSAGPVVWIICSEIFPLRARDIGITASTASNWLCNVVVGATFLTMLNTLGSANTFWLYGGLNLIFIVVLLLFVPETKGVTLEKIEENLLSGKKLVHIGR